MRLSVFSVYRAPKGYSHCLLISSVHVLFWLMLINADFMPVLFLIDNDLLIKIKSSFWGINTTIFLVWLIRNLNMGHDAILSHIRRNVNCFILCLTLSTHPSVFVVFNDLMIITSSEIWYTYQFRSALWVP